jgi:indole-3-glycerol phosphate synthase
VIYPANFLLSIMEAKRAEMAQVSFAEREVLASQAACTKNGTRDHAFLLAVSAPERMNIIAEIKRSSPSAGTIQPEASAKDVAVLYQRSGAAALSVLTEPRFFSGSLGDLRAVTGAVAVPCLRKDFIVDRHQICEAAVARARAVLLIVAALSTAELLSLRQFAEDELGLDALVEVHSLEEMERAVDCGANLIGVNNRNLATLQVDLNTSRKLAGTAGPGKVLVSESGLRTPEHLRELRALGYNAFLIGESLMRAPNPAAYLAVLLEEGRDA